MLLGYTMLMTGTFAIGIVALIVFTTVLMHRYARQVIATREAVASDRNHIVAQAAELDRRLGRRLVEGSDTRQCVNQWQQERGDLLPGHGWKWALDVLKRCSDQSFAERVQRIKHRVAFQGMLGLVTITGICGGITLVLYNSYASTADMTSDQAGAELTWPDDGSGGNSNDLFPDLLGPDLNLLPAPSAPADVASPSAPSATP